MVEKRPFPKGKFIIKTLSKTWVIWDHVIFLFIDVNCWQVGL